MAVAFDAVTDLGSTTGNDSNTHTPVGTPRGVLLTIVGTGGTTDEVTGATYGGVAMTEVGSPVTNADDVQGVIHAFFLGASIPTGAQTIAYTTSGATITHRALCYTITAAADTEVEDTQTSTATGTALSVTLVIATDSWYSAFLWSGVNTPANLTEGANLTEDLGLDFGSSTASFCRSTTNVSTNTAAEFTQTSNPYALRAVAITEATGAQTVSFQVIAAGSTVNSPTVSVGAVSVALNAITAASTVNSPSVVQVVALNAITASATVQSPTVTVGAVTVAFSLISAPETVNSPTVSQSSGAQTVTFNAVTASAVVNSPTVTVGAVTVSLQLIAVAAVVNSPTVTGGATAAATAHRSFTYRESTAFAWREGRR